MIEYKENPCKEILNKFTLKHVLTILLPYTIITIFAVLLPKILISLSILTIAYELYQNSEEEYISRNNS